MAITKQRIKKIIKDLEKQKTGGMLFSLREIFDEIEREDQEEKLKQKEILCQSQNNE